MNITNCINQAALRRMLGIKTTVVSKASQTRFAKGIFAIEDYLNANRELIDSIKTTRNTNKRARSQGSSVIIWDKFVKLYKNPAKPRGEHLAQESVEAWEKINAEIAQLIKNH